MKYLKLFENEKSFNIGDYVIIIVDDFYNNWYGKIIQTYNSIDICDIKIMNKDTNRKKILVNKKYLIKFNTKEEFDKAVEKIEMEKTAKKFGL